MSTRELGVAGDGPCIVNQEGDHGPIHRQLKEVIELVSSTNQKLEDCAVEWQAKISQAQWRILDTKPGDNTPWEKSVLARTYFTDKTLDDAFQGVLKYNNTFTDHLKNFVALVRGEQPTLIIKQTCNAQNQCSDSSLENEVKNLPSDYSVLEENPAVVRRGRRSLSSILNKAQESFTDLIKTKIEFDTKFLGFEATLNGNVCATSDPSLSLCQICSRILKCGIPGTTACKTTKNHKNIEPHKKRTRCSNRIKHKRLKPTKCVLRTKCTKVTEKTIRESSPVNTCFK
ncbi:uncharacterized protein [Neodiprion pinetum]|uniref:uncharacterized protein n=1 Tax=Neodiprion pinetum TaxID=441929 RepID=UPI001EDCC37A|nr:uncharacterized protein LOC124211448 [Neodiprion pinetum]